MLQVCVSRLRQALPFATLSCLTEVPHRLPKLCPGVVPVSATGRYAWLADDYLLNPLHRVMPRSWSRAAGAAKRRLTRASPGLFERLIAAKARLRGLPGCDAGPFLAAVREADLVVVSGIGALTDSARLQSHFILETLRIAHQAGVPTAMVGQGVGPLTDAGVLRAAREVLPRVDLIAVREGVRSPQLLASWGVAPGRIRLTGDDAVEAAHGARPRQLGTGLGVNIRITPYAGTDLRVLERVRGALHETARSLAAPLVSLPIRRHVDSPDASAIQSLLEGYERADEGGAAIDTPLGVIQAAGRCRCVVTGAYHAAVLALSQGVPAVCLAASPYYRHKFEGLAERFGSGVEIVDLARADAGATLHTAVDRLWADAATLRDSLLAAAANQIRLGRDAMAAVCRLAKGAPVTEPGLAPVKAVS